MTVRGRVVSIARAVGSGAIWKDKPELLRALSCLLHVLLGFTLASGRIFQVCAPFGIGIVAQAGGGLAGAMCLLGASGSYLLLGGFAWGIRYVACCVLVYTASFIFQGLKLYKTAWFMPMVTAMIAAITGFLNTYEAAGDIPAVVRMLTEVLLAAGTTYFFRIALSDETPESETAELRRGVSLVILLSCILMAFARISILGVISIGRLLAVLVVMALAFRGGLLAGAAAGAALGLAMDISAGGAPVFTMAYAFSGLIAGMFSKHGRLFFLVSYVLADAVAIVWTWGDGMRLEALYECFAASVIFMILPAGLLNQVGSALQRSPQGSGEAGLRRYSAGRIRRTGEAFRDLYDTVRKSLEESANDNDVARIFDRAADAVCATCKQKNQCWQTDYMDTLSIMNDVTPVMMKNGRLTREDMPQRFWEKCPSAYAFLASVNGEIRALMYRKQFRSRLEENRTAAYGQYADMATIMEDVAQELGAAGGSDPLAERRLIRYLRTMDIEADVSVFRDKSGRLRATVESRHLAPLLRGEGYLEKLSSVLGVRLCRSSAEEALRENRLLLLEAEPLAVSVGIAAMKKRGETVSGDRGTYFKTDQGVLCVILSDGMGSGEEAARESIAAVRILERFLKAGVEPGTAMKVLNSVMLLKNGEEWGFATVDLMCINLFTGETSLYKYGAAPSYIRTGKMVRRIKGQSLAAGLCAGEGAAPDVVRMKLRPGALALIVSDGILVQEEDAWLRGILANWDGGETKELAKEALQGAVKQYGCSDDMTVLAIYVDNRA